MSGLHKAYYRYVAFLSSAYPKPIVPSVELFQAWEKDGIRLRAFLCGHAPDPRRVQMVLETTADLSPGKIAQRLKGRCQHFLRNRDASAPKFHRDYLLGSLGQNDQNIVTRYIREQVDRSDLVDTLYRKRMKDLHFHQAPSAPSRGKHRCIQDLFLHVVLVTAGRYRMFSAEARRVADALIAGTDAEGMDLVELSMMPDHAHLLVRPSKEASPLDTLNAIKESSGREMHRTAFWQNGGYTGTVGPYKMDVAISKTRQLGGWVG